MINYISKLYFPIICDIAIPPYFIRYFAHLSFPAHCARLRFFVHYFPAEFTTIPLVVHFLCKYMWPKVPQQTTFGGAVADDVVASGAAEYGGRRCM